MNNPYPTGNGYQCASCGMWVMPGAFHQCGAPAPGVIPGLPQWQMPQCRAPWTPPLTAEDIRKIIREELDRKPERPSDNGGEQR